MPHPPEFTDTDPRAMEVWLSLQRNMAPGDKLIAVLDASALVLSMLKRAYVCSIRMQAIERCCCEPPRGTSAAT